MRGALRRETIGARFVHLARQIKLVVAARKMERAKMANASVITRWENASNTITAKGTRTYAKKRGMLPFRSTPFHFQKNTFRGYLETPNKEI